MPPKKQTSKRAPIKKQTKPMMPKKKKEPIYVSDDSDSDGPLIPVNKKPVINYITDDSDSDEPLILGSQPVASAKPIAPPKRVVNSKPIAPAKPQQNSNTMQSPDYIAKLMIKKVPKDYVYKDNGSGDENDVIYEGTRIIPNVENRLFTHNVGTAEERDAESGNCALISFFQFVRASRIHFDDFYNNFLKQHVLTYHTDRLDIWELNNKLKKIKPLWDAIIDNKINNWRMIGYGEDYLSEEEVDKRKKRYEDMIQYDDNEMQKLLNDRTQKFDKEYYDELKEDKEATLKDYNKFKNINRQGTMFYVDTKNVQVYTRYLLVCAINQLILYATTGVRELDDSDNFDLDTNQISYFDKYISFISKYTKTIPFLVMCEGIFDKQKFLNYSFEKITTNHIFCEIYDVDNKKLYCFDSNLFAPEAIIYKNLFHPYTYEPLMYSSSLNNVSIGSPQNTSELKNRKYIDLTYTYNTVFTTKNKEIVHTDHSAPHVLSLFVQSINMSLRNFFKMFENTNDNIKGTKYDNIIDKVNELEQYLPSNNKIWPNCTFYYNITEVYGNNEQDTDIEYKNNLYTIFSDILDAIFVCIIGHTLNKAMNIIMDVDNNMMEVINMKKNYNHYVDTMMAYVKYVPLISYGINRTNMNNIESIFQKFPGASYDFMLLDSTNKKIWKYYIYKIPFYYKNGGTVNKLDEENVGYASYIPIFNYWSIEHFANDRFQPFEIKENCISPLIQTQKDKQLDKAYLTLV